MKIVKPSRKRYAKVCKCDKIFFCDGICDKEEILKLTSDACYCPECYKKTWGEKKLCESRKRLLGINPEKVEFT